MTHSSVINISTVDGTLAMEMMSYGNKLADQYSSLDSSDTFLSCNTHPYPSQGSLAGLEELAAKGSMAANGSMPAVNISGFSNNVFNGNSVFSTLFDPRKRSPASPKGNASPANHHRRVRIASRSLSSDNELEAWADCIEEGEKRYQDESEPKHRRSRLTQGPSPKLRPRFDLESTNQVEFDLTDDERPRHSYMTTRGLAAVYQGLASLSEKLGRSNKYCASGPMESINLSVVKSVTSPSGQRKKSILKKSDSLGGRGSHGGDPERENLLVSDPDSLNATPLAPRKYLHHASPKYDSHERIPLPPHASLPNVHSKDQHQCYEGASTGTPPSSSFTSDELLDERSAPSHIAMKDIQTSTTTLAQSIAASDNTKATNTTKFERGRDPSHCRDIGITAKTAVRDDSGIGFESSNLATAPNGPRCTNQTCRINKPSSASSTSTRIVCICGHHMVQTISSPPEDESTQRISPNLTHAKAEEGFGLPQATRLLTKHSELHHDLPIFLNYASAVAPLCGSCSMILATFLYNVADMQQPLNNLMLTSKPGI
eukprot:TCALIF_06684-PB protein Name:"Protein of unknown function" AED:0.10 eAED:0.10 QI:0/0.6/0.5/1/0.6/0.5/6/2425/542